MAYACGMDHEFSYRGHRIQLLPLYRFIPLRWGAFYAYTISGPSLPGPTSVPLEEMYHLRTPELARAAAEKALDKWLAAKNMEAVLALQNALRPLIKIGAA